MNKIADTFRYKTHILVFRSILMKLIYNDKYSIIDSNMSDSNVGAGRKRISEITFLSSMV